MRNANAAFAAEPGDICTPETQYMREDCQGEGRSERPGWAGRVPTAADLGGADRAVLPRVSDPSPGNASNHLFGKKEETDWAKSRCPWAQCAMKPREAEKAGMEQRPGQQAAFLEQQPACG